VVRPQRARRVVQRQPVRDDLDGEAGLVVVVLLLTTCGFCCGCGCAVEETMAPARPTVRVLAARLLLHCRVIYGVLHETWAC
jgi:hypothetical protein